MINGKPTADYERILADNGMPVTEEQARAEFEAIVKDEGLITNTSRMSPFWRLITAITTKPVMWLKDALVNVVMKNLFLADASGVFVDVFAWAVNLQRKAATHAAGVIRFTKNDIDRAVTVPAGTQIQTERINGVIYTLTVVRDTVIPAGTPSMNIDVSAEQAGAGFNLAPGYYRILPVAIDGIAGVENDENWLTTPDRIYFLHDAPRGPGTANAYILLDTGIASEPFVDAVNAFINDEGHHGHGDDLRCFSMPETRHTLTVTLWLYATLNLSDEEIQMLLRNVENLVRCAFRENSDYDVQKTWPYSRFSMSRLGEEIHQVFPQVESVTFSLPDILSDLAVPRLESLTVEVSA
ncbi:baseplate J/gp47 family protein [Escherichia coli]|uniref:baseplate J/gp47 family protein n=1 Tax=Escherichia coli TaxID=562 RepID=UPI0013753E7B|nr:baseplate J/gp47 family protein [Escherichia coli]QHR35596.1 hypothetical protein FNE83_07810 [Escherichia coli]